LEICGAAQIPKHETHPADNFPANAGSMIEDLKVLANRRDVPYKSLLKVFLAERLEKERRRA